MRFLLMFIGIAMGMLHAQKGFEYIGTLPFHNVEIFGVDQFKNIYIVKGNELKKIDPRGNESYSFSDPILGNIAQIDVLNALNPYIFYKDAYQLVVVDNRLNSSTALNFTDLGYLDVQYISFSDQSNVWCYDQATDKLYRVNIQTKKLTNQSVNITRIIGEENRPTALVSTIDHVYLNVPESGIFSFDAVGGFEKLLPLKGVTSFDLRGNIMYILKEGSVFLYNLSTAQLTPVLFNEKNILSLKVLNDRLYFLTGEGIKIYRQTDER